MKKAHSAVRPSKILTPDQKTLNFLFSQTEDLCLELTNKLEVSTANPAAMKLYKPKQKKFSMCSSHAFLEHDPILLKFFSNPKALHNKLKKCKGKPFSVLSKIFDTEVLWKIKPQWDKSKGLLRIILIGHNLAELHRTEMARDAKFSLETMIAHLPGNVYWMDTNCVHIGCNDNVLKMVGLTHDQYVGKTYEQLAKIVPWTHGEAESFKKDDMEVLRSGKPKINVEEPPVRHRDGSISYYLTTRVPMKNKAGQIVGVAGISIDITERKKAEVELREAKQRAEIAVEAKSQFLENISHDFITPLSIIINAADAAIAHGNDSTKRIEYCDDIKATTRTLLNYVQDILEIAQFDYQKMPLKKEVFDLQKLVFEVIRIFSIPSEKKKLKLILDYHEDVPQYVVGDKQRIRRILNNLIANSIKFTKKGQVSLKVEVISRKLNHIRLALTVRDTGIGIPKSEVKKIFERFTRLQSSYRGHYKGLGLGLSIVKEFVEQMNGEIYVESQSNVGTTIKCEIECQAVSVKTIQTIVKKKEVDKNSIFDSLALRDKFPFEILLVEDDRMIQKFMQIILSSFGAKVVLANNAKEAISLATQNQYKLILLDIGLPDQDGLYVAKKIRVYEAQHKLKPQLIIALTAHVSEKNKELGDKIGINQFYSKPLTKENFLNICDKYHLMSGIKVLSD